jgi:MFS family permease
VTSGAAERGPSGARAGGGGYKWLVVGMLWLVCLFNYADRQAIFSVFPLLRAEMGLSPLQLGVVASSFMWVYALALPFAGIVGDRVNRKALVLGGLVFWSAITLATALSTRFWHLVLFRALEGLGEAFYFPASMSLIAEYHGPETRSRAMSLHQSSVYVGTIAGGTLAGFLADRYGWRSGFYVFGILGVVLGFVLVAFLREPPRSRSSADEGHGKMVLGRTDLPWILAAEAGAVAVAAAVFLWSSNLQPFATATGRWALGLAAILGLAAVPLAIARTQIWRSISSAWVVMLIGVFVGANFVAMVFLTWLPSFLHDKFAMSLTLSGLSGTAYLQIASVVGVVVGGVLADRLVRRRAGGRMAAQAIGLILGVPFLALMGWTLSVPVLVLAMTGFGFFKGIYDANIWASLYDVVKPERRATALGLMNAAGWLGGATAPVAVAAASARVGMSACLSATSAVYALVGVALGLTARRVSAARAGEPSRRDETR